MTSPVRDSVTGILGGAPAGSEDDARRQFGRLVAGGWATAGIPEHLGGAGGSLTDAADVTAAVATAGASLPAGETAITGGWLLQAAGLRLPEGPHCVVPVTGPAAGSLARTGSGLLLTLRAERVPWASWASHLIALVPGDAHSSWVVTVDATAATVRRGANLAGEPRDSVELADVPVLGEAAVNRPYQDLLAGLTATGALTRSIQMAAALARITEMTARYCTQREQFGRPLAAFQAVQQQLAELAGESAAADAAVALALAGADGSRRHQLAAVAKTRTGRAAGAGARIAHQLHGAIGVTQEHPLPRYTRALWSWREEFGPESYWERYLAGQVAEPGLPLWEWVTSAG